MSERCSVSERRMTLKQICVRLKTNRPLAQISKMIRDMGIEPVFWREVKNQSRQTPIYSSGNFEKIKEMEKKTMAEIKRKRQLCQ